jgi:hypothetical protein
MTTGMEGVPTGSLMAVYIFHEDESGYLAWLSTHPSGYVLNCDPDPRPDYLMLHRSSCKIIRVLQPRAKSFTSRLMKVCADTATELDRWAVFMTGAHPTHRCSSCSLNDATVQRLGKLR